jgi:K+-transporting ATPase A subunit
MMEVRSMAKKDKGLPDVTEPKVGPERIVHEKEDRPGPDWKALYTLLGAGAICGVCMWVAFTFVGGEVDLASLFGAVVGGVVSGGAIYALT